MDSLTSPELYREACELMPGGVNSPVRAFKAVGGTPVYFASAEGPYLRDVEGKEYIDFVSSWGAIILGHADKAVTEAIYKAAKGGTSYGAPHPGEIALAREVTSRVPGLEKVRFVNSGTEATLAVIRLARAATGRDKILKIAGHYHGAVDSLLAEAGSGVATLALAGSDGVPASAISQTLVIEFNDTAGLRLALAGRDIAAVMIEPVAGNMGLVPPGDEYLQAVREVCAETGTLLIFDEVMTGFRLAKGGASERFGVTPDLYTFGKVIGGGLPVGAYGGRQSLMEMVAPLGPVYQAGTLAGNPVGMAAGLAALVQLQTPQYERLEAVGAQLEEGLKRIFQGQASVARVGSMISVFFTHSAPTNYAEAKKTDREKFAKWFHACLDRGVYLPPSALESWFLNLAHSPAVIDEALSRMRLAWQSV